MYLKRLTVLVFPALATIVGAGTQTPAERGFKPIVEADMPEGFPEPTPVGLVEVKHYPAYRMARADGDGSSGFWTLFRHIKKNRIAMSAPVQLDYAASASAATTMAFLYGDPSEGSPGLQANVHLVDVPPMRVVSIGVRGVHDESSIASARRQLDAWLEANRSRYEAEASLRVMAYNSPFVPRHRRYFEVQIPVRERPE